MKEKGEGKAEWENLMMIETQNEEVGIIVQFRLLSKTKWMSKEGTEGTKGHGEMERETEKLTVDGLEGRKKKGAILP